MRPDRSIDEYASRQYGAFSLAQARRAGLTDGMVQRRLESGAWIPLAPQVYAMASAPPKWERQLAAAVLSRPGSIVSGVAAAALYRFEGFPKGRREITVPAGGNARSPLAKVTRSRWFDQLATSQVDGFTVTSPAETIMALAGRLPLLRMERLVDEGLAGQWLTTQEFDPIRERNRGGRVRGAARLTAILDERSDTAWQPPGNELERYLDLLVDHPGIPPATRQHPFSAGRSTMIVDRYIDLWWLILEADGRRWHTRRADFERDRARDNAAAAQGIAVLRFTWTMLTQDMAACRQTLLETGARRVARF
ncbi:MAG: type IV toxin-antitoxin system AbiEi family antitoxin domain-containing protein [Acidimicrobiia bacterium]